MFNKLTIKSRLIFVLGFLSLLLLGIGIMGMINLGSVNASLRSMYDDRLVALGKLDQVVRIINRNQQTAARAMSTDLYNWDKLAEQITQRMAEASKVWDEYTAMRPTPEEKMLADEFAQRREKYLAESMRPVVAAMRAQDLQAATEIVQGPMERLYGPVRESMDALIQLQLAEGKKQFEDSQAAYNVFRTISIALLAFGVLLSAFIGVLLVRAITRPLNEAVRIAKRVADGDLTQKIEVRSKDETGQLLHALKDMNASLVDIVGRVRTGTDAIATASSQVASGNLDLSSRTEQQASALEETASSMEELTGTVKQNADNARQANRLAESASDVAVKGGQVVSQVVDTMGSINDSAKKIVDIIAVIDGIAFQTNILALNAAVEAARAGEQGRGFAVVAAEVRNLAQRSAAAAKEIKTLIDDSVDKVDAGSQLVDQAGATMDKIVSSVRRVTDIMAEITAASQEQSAGIGQVNQAIAQMDQTTQQNASLVEEAAAAAESLQGQAANLAQVVGVFKLAGTPVDGMRAEAANAVAKPPVPKPVAATNVIAPNSPPALIGAGAGQPKRLAHGKSTEREEWEEF
jgi:methyl-accepting chemotaxis protein